MVCNVKGSLWPSYTRWLGYFVLIGGANTLVIRKVPLTNPDCQLARPLLSFLGSALPPPPRNAAYEMPSGRPLETGTEHWSGDGGHSRGTWNTITRVDSMILRVPEEWRPLRFFSRWKFSADSRLRASGWSIWGNFYAKGWHRVWGVLCDRFWID